jgi:hypothetical protein
VPPSAPPAAWAPPPPPPPPSLGRFFPPMGPLLAMNGSVRSPFVFTSAFFPSGERGRTKPGGAVRGTLPFEEKTSGRGEAIPGWAMRGQRTAGWPRAGCPAPEDPGSPVLPKRHSGRRASLHFSQRGGGWESRSELRGQRCSCSSRRAAGQAPHVDASRGECVTPQPPRELALRRGSALCWMRWTTRAATDCGVRNSYAYATGDGAVQQRTRGGKAGAATPRSVSMRAGAQEVRLCAVSAIAFICSQARARP